jgi:hypothetical protein
MDIDWKKLRQANGPATKIPQYVKALNGNKGANDRARNEQRIVGYQTLRQALITGGQWYSASLPASQLLLEEAGKKERPGLALVLRLLTDLMCADHLHWLARQASEAGVPDPIEREVRALVATFGDEVRALLEDDDPRVREEAAMFLGCLVEQAEASLSALKVRIAGETDPKALASVLMATAVLKHNIGAEPAELRQFTDVNRDLRVRGLAAIGLMICGKSQPRSISSILWEFLVRNDGGCWSGGHCDALVIAASRSAGSACTDEVVDALVDQLALMGKAQRDGSENASSVILTLAGFKERWPDEHTVALPEELTARQRQLAERLARCGTPYGFGYGLPLVTRFIGRWLGDAPPTLLEERIDVTVNGTKLSRPRWWAWKHADESGIDGKSVDAYIARLDVPMQIRLIGSFASLGYWLGDVDSDLADPRRLPELLGRLPEGDVAWAQDYADELLEEPCEDTPAGLIVKRLLWVRYAVLTILVRSRVPLKPAWVALVPYSAPRTMTLGALLEQLPYDFREEGTYRCLFAFTRSCLEALVPVLELVASRRIVEKLLEMARSSDSSKQVPLEVRPQLYAKFDEIASTRPEIRDWIKEWKDVHAPEG